MSADGVTPSPMLTAPTSPHKRSLKYARIRIVFDGRDKAVRRCAQRLAPFAPLTGRRCRLNAKGFASSVDHAHSLTLA